MSIVTVLSITTIIMLVRPPELFSNLFEIQPFSNERIEENLFRIVMLTFPVVHLILAVVIEVNFFKLTQFFYLLMTIYVVQEILLIMNLTFTCIFSFNFFFLIVFDGRSSMV